MLTTIVSFLPVFAMQAQEGKLFHPLAFTKTFALISALLLGLSLLPTLAYYVFSIKVTSARVRKITNIVLIAGGILLFVFTGVLAALALTLFGLNNFLAYRWTNKKIPTYINIGIAILVAVYYLTIEWLPIGPQEGFF